MGGASTWSAWAAVFFLWALGEAACIALGAGLAYLFFPETKANFSKDNTVDEFTRISTTITDAILIVFFFALAWHYERSIRAGGDTPLLAGPGAVPIADGGSGTTTGAQDEPQQQRKWSLQATDAVWSALLTPVRMADTFYSSGAFASFYRPVQVFAAARIGALLIGLIPGVIGGVPSTSVQLAQALYFAAAKQRMDRAMAKPEQASYPADVARYCFCKCIQVYEDARAVDNFRGVEYTGCCTQAVVGPPVLASMP